MAAPNTVTKSPEAGFTLVETMVAMVIFLVGVLAVVYGSLSLPLLVQQSQSLNQSGWIADDLSSILVANPGDISQVNGMNTQRSTTFSSAAITAWATSIPGHLNAGFATASTLSGCTQAPCVVDLDVHWMNHNTPENQQFLLQVGF